MSLHAITRFNIAKAFPIETEASFEDLSKKTGIEMRTLRRLLRHGMTRHLFRETKKGWVAHTGLTKLLAEEDLLYDNTLCALEELWPPSTKV